MTTDRPSIVVHRPVDAAIFGGKTVVPYADGEDGDLLGFALSHSRAPHMLLAGPTGSGVSTTLRVIALEAARQGVEVAFATRAGRCWGCAAGPTLQRSNPPCRA